ncbi:hypothetical protein EYZ11_002228 [Aspergillus tanneri]|uniref:Heterokaryon incompatibility domain-containing protein n=1 Tax=Aspergillus tanneri TaxID=1220188 RepID=A0A4S3JRR3_9EURO|nr:hypothetical protein EYZ11_002228 [Aspergillus tanneri]
MNSNSLDLLLALNGGDPAPVALEIRDVDGPYPLSRVALAWNDCNTTTKLASFMQTSLFFELLAAFLNHEIVPSDFIRDGFINLNTDKMDRHFRRWRSTLSQLSRSAQNQAQELTRTLIGFAQYNSDLFEEVADHLGEDEIFDRISLSVKLLINFLSEISDDSFSLIGPPPSGISNSWLRNVVSRSMHWHKTNLFWLQSDDHHELLQDRLDRMSEANLKNHLYGRSNRFLPFPLGVDQGGRAARLMYNLFVNNGWCPHRALQLCRSYDYLVLNSLVGLIRRPPSVENHAQCLEMRRCCSHNLVLDGLDDYPFAHDSHGAEQQCPFVHVPINQLIDIIDSRSIPLISLSREGDLDIQVVRCTPFMSYTAISHVWSDGMGNPQSNSLPQCQLLRLRRLIAETYNIENDPLYDNSTASSIERNFIAWELRKSHAQSSYRKVDKKRIYFWMDTLCIPTTSSSRSAQRNKALKFMAMKHITPIFASATNTLVLEKQIQSVRFPDPRDVSGDEIAALVLSSKWMLRGWTLEEGSLSAQVVYHIAGKPYEMATTLHHQLPRPANQHSPAERANIICRRKVPLILKRSLLEEKLHMMLATHRKAFYLSKELRVPQFVWAWNSLLERSTTKAEDGPLILANILDYNVAAFKNVPSAARLKLLIQSCDELPLSVLYNTSGERLSIPGHPELGWIPCSIDGDHLNVGGHIRMKDTTNT